MRGQCCSARAQIDALPGRSTPPRRRRVDPFGQPADCVIEDLRLLDVRLVVREKGISVDAPDELVGLWRDGDPIGDDDLPLYFAAALVAAPGHYDRS